MNTATVVQSLTDWDTSSVLYRLTPPLGDTEHVIVSAVSPVNGDHGAIVLAADSAGQVTSWDPIARSESDDHTVVLAALGYEVSA